MAWETQFYKISPPRIAVYLYTLCLNCYTCLDDVRCCHADGYYSLLPDRCGRGRRDHLPAGGPIRPRSIENDRIQLQVLYHRFQGGLTDWPHSNFASVQAHVFGKWCCALVSLVPSLPQLPSLMSLPLYSPIALMSAVLVCSTSPAWEMLSCFIPCTPMEPSTSMHCMAAAL